MITGKGIRFDVVYADSSNLLLLNSDLIWKPHHEYFSSYRNSSFPMSAPRISKPALPTHNRWERLPEIWRRHHGNGMRSYWSYLSRITDFGGVFSNKPQFILVYIKKQLPQLWNDASDTQASRHRIILQVQVYSSQTFTNVSLFHQ